MDDPALVRVFQGLGDLAGDREAFLQGERSRFEPIRQRRPVDEFHHQRAHAVRLLEAEDRRDVGVVELGEQLRLALEARETFGVRGEGGGENLDRDVALQPRVRRPVDLPHPAFAELGGDLVWAYGSANHRRVEDESAHMAPHPSRVSIPAPIGFGGVRSCFLHECPRTVTPQPAVVLEFSLFQWRTNEGSRSKDHRRISGEYLRIRAGSYPRSHGRRSGGALRLSSRSDVKDGAWPGAAHRARGRVAAGRGRGREVRSGQGRIGRVRIDDTGRRDCTS